MDTEDRLPVSADVEEIEGGLAVRFSVVDVDDVELTGAVPKAIALHELSFQERPDGDWSCQVTIDI
jgi:SHS2 domain-containing protein